MQLFPCPFCGPRSESEFHFMGDDGNARPAGLDVPAQAWAEYLGFRNNPMGDAAEVWMHLPCGEVFRMDRNTVDHRILSATALPGEGDQ